MKEQQKINNNLVKRRVFIGGIPQNVFLKASTIDTSIIPEHLKNHTQKKYEALERVHLSNGYTEDIVEKDYPINSESVSSYIDSADYRNDPAQAVANAPKRVNLGDITDAQKFIEQSPVQAMGQYADILKKVSDYFKAQASQSVKNDGSINQEPKVGE